MSTTGSGDAAGKGNKTGFVSRMLLKAFGPAQITPADDEDRQAQRDHHDHEGKRPEKPGAPR